MREEREEEGEKEGVLLRVCEEPQGVQLPGLENAP